FQGGHERSYCGNLLGEVPSRQRQAVRYDRVVCRRHWTCMELYTIGVADQAGDRRAHLLKRLTVGGHPLLGKLDLNAGVDAIELLRHSHRGSPYSVGSAVPHFPMLISQVTIIC